MISDNDLISLEDKLKKSRKRKRMLVSNKGVFRVVEIIRKKRKKR